MHQSFKFLCQQRLGSNNDFMSLEFDDVRYLTMTELEAGLTAIRQTPKNVGVLQLIVRRPRVGEREVLQEAQLDLIEGLVGDRWRARNSSIALEDEPARDMQLTIMSTRAIALLAPQKERWPLAGDQLYIELDLSKTNAPPGTQLAVGSAVIQVTSPPHTGCRKFKQRFGEDALNFVNSPAGRELQLRGINAKVIRPGVIRVGDAVKKL